MAGLCVSDSEMCVICGCPLILSAVNSLASCHRFHLKCSTRVLQLGVKAACPICSPGKDDVCEQACRRYFLVELEVNGLWDSINPDQQREVDAILRLWTQATEHGSSNAFYNLGVVFETGSGASKNLLKALRCHQKACALGDPLSLNALGVMHLQGRGVHKSYTEAFRLFNEAARQGIADAQFNIGCMFKDGKGALLNYEEALKWFR
jgi:TPR repeat protein